MIERLAQATVIFFNGIVIVCLVILAVAFFTGCGESAEEKAHNACMEEARNGFAELGWSGNNRERLAEAQCDLAADLNGGS